MYDSTRRSEPTASPGPTNVDEAMALLMKRAGEIEDWNHLYAEALIGRIRELRGMFAMADYR